MNNKTIRIQAKKLLENNWKAAIFLTIILIIGSTCALYLPEIQPLFYDKNKLFFFIFYIILFIIVLIFNYMFSLAFIDINESNKLSFNNLIIIFKQNPIKFIKLLIVNTILIILWSLLFVIPGIIKAISYSQAFYILKENPEIGVLEAITKSRKLMDGKKMQYFKLTLVIELPLIITVIIGIALMSGINSHYINLTGIDSEISFTQFIIKNSELLTKLDILGLIISEFIYSLLLLYIQPILYAACAIFYKSLEDKQID